MASLSRLSLVKILEVDVFLDLVRVHSLQIEPMYMNSSSLQNELMRSFMLLSRIIKQLLSFTHPKASVADRVVIMCC